MRDGCVRPALVVSFLVAWFAAAFASVADAAAPGNDALSDAVQIGALPYVYTTWRQREADVEPDEMEPSCVPPSFGISNSVWFELRAQTAQMLALETSLSAPIRAGSVGDTVLAVYVRSDGMLHEVACNNDLAGLSAALRDVPVEPGVRYAIQLANFDADPLKEPGLLVLNISSDAPTLERSGIAISQQAVSTRDPRSRRSKIDLDQDGISCKRRPCRSRESSECLHAHEEPVCVECKRLAPAS